MQALSLSSMGKLTLQRIPIFLRTLHRVPAKPKISKKAAPDEGCPVCREGLQYFGYRDVLLLRQFLTPDGHILGRRYTKICPKLQRRVVRCIRRSRKEGLLPNFRAESKNEITNQQNN